MRAASCCPGELYFDSRYAVFRGRLGDTGTHAHATGQWMAARPGERAQVLLADGRKLSGRAIVIAPQTRHSLPAPEQDLVVVWFDASRIGALGTTLACGACPVPLARGMGEGVDAVFAAPGGHAFREAARSLAGRLLEGNSGEHPDPVVAAAVERLEQNFDASVDARTLAQQLGISTSTLARRFRAALGMAPRAYRLWVRLKRGLAHAAGGASLTDAAHEAGFSDAAHFTRTFRHHFGLAPSQVAPLLSRGHERAPSRQPPGSPGHQTR